MSVQLTIERVTEVTDEVMEATQRFAPLLGSSNQVSITPEYLERIVRNPDVHWLMARRSDDNRFVGTATIVIMPMMTNVRSMFENLVVEESARGLGVGFALCEHALKIADENQVNTVRTAAGKQNAASNLLLGRIGFIAESYLNNYEFDIHDGPRF